MYPQICALAAHLLHSSFGLALYHQLKVKMISLLIFSSSNQIHTHDLTLFSLPSEMPVLLLSPFCKSETIYNLSFRTLRLRSVRLRTQYQVF